MAVHPSFYLDENVDIGLAARLRAHGLDAITAREAGRLRAADEDQLTFAASVSRVVITHDVRDYSRIARVWAAAGRTHSGIILAPQVPVPELADGILSLAALYPNASDYVGCTLRLASPAT